MLAKPIAWLRAGAPPETAAEANADSGQAGPLISVRDGAVRVGGRQLWSGMDLSVTAGQFIAVLGPNGAGKSTLLKAILGLLPLAAGEMRVLGTAPGQARYRIGYLPQRRAFDASLRIRGSDVVRLGWDGDRWGVPVPWGAHRRAANARVTEVLDLVGARDYAHRPIGELSGGEQQRLLIAQALVQRPALLLLDEPLDSLDLSNQAAVAALISRISRQEQVAVVMVAHDINPILSYLDQVVYLARGQALSGRPESVITSETLTKLYGTTIEVLRTADGRLAVVGQPEAPGVHNDRHTGDARA